MLADVFSHLRFDQAGWPCVFLEPVALAPVGEALVPGEDQASLFIASGDQPKEQAGLLTVHGQVADLAENQDLGIAQQLQLSL